MNNQENVTDAKKELAELLSAIMKHPETPVAVYNAIGDAICDMSCNIDYDTPDMIERSLVAYFLSGEQERDENRTVRKPLPTADNKNLLVVQKSVDC